MNAISEFFYLSPEAFVWFLFLLVFVLILSIAAGLEAAYNRHRRRKMRQGFKRKIKNRDLAR